MKPTSNETVVKPVQASGKKTVPLVVVLVVVIVLGGLLVGWLAAGKRTYVPTYNNASSVTTNANEAGAKDTSSFKDTATGTLQAGGIKGEGTYHLDRPGGKTQTVYLTSTVIDMSTFVGKKVQVWGQTQASKYAPWFMDVGKIKVVE